MNLVTSVDILSALVEQLGPCLRASEQAPICRVLRIPTMFLAHQIRNIMHCTGLMDPTMDAWLKHRVG